MQFLVPSYVRDYFLWSMNNVVLPSLYEYPEHSCDHMKVGLDTRLCTSPHTKELLWCRGSLAPSTLNETKEYSNCANVTFRALWH